VCISHANCCIKPETAGAAHPFVHAGPKKKNGKRREFIKRRRKKVEGIKQNLKIMTLSFFCDDLDL
jgi:hypothetical protein